MSVIWSGVTEEGAVVPVQVTAEGKVVAVGDGPEGDYLKLTGGNLTGDLTVNEQITLATDGSASFAGQLLVDRGATKAGLGWGSAGVWVGDVTSTDQNNAKARLNEDGSATFASDVKIGGTLPSAPNISLNAADGSAEFAGGAFKLNGDGVIETNVNTNGNIKLSGAGDFNSPKITLGAANGSATFIGDVVIGSRGEQWLIRESNGVAMLVQQTLRQPREIEKLRDLPNELDLIEAALNEVMEKLRMTPPAGWPVWDGESEVTSDNDNA